MKKEKIKKILEESCTIMNEMVVVTDSYENTATKIMSLFEEVKCPVCMTSDVTFSHDKVVNLKSDDIHLKVYTCNHCQRNFSN